MPGSFDWLPSCAREHLTDSWYNMHLQSILRCDSILSISDSVYFSPGTSGAVPMVGTCFWMFLGHLGEALKRIKAICEENKVRETQGKTDGSPSLG